jgi:RNA polymerase sigma-70 factor (ECF subfamily)
MFLRSKLINRNDPDRQTDGELLTRFKDTNNPLIIGELFNRYTHLVFGVCMKYLKNEEDAKDAVMQIFENLFHDLKVHDVGNFKNWIHTVTKNFCLMELRKVKNEVTMKEAARQIFQGTFVETTGQLHLDGDPDNEDKSDKLKDAISQLNKEQKTCIELLYLHKKSYTEITRITGYDLKKVKSYIQNGKRNLKNLLSN